MRGTWARVTGLALLLLLRVDRAAAEYRTAEVELLRITIDSDWASHTTPGYVPVRFDVTNLGDARVIEIVGEGIRFSAYGRGGQSVLHLRQALRLGRGDRVRVTLPIPVSSESENIRFEIQEDGRTLERFGYSNFQSGKPANQASALIVADAKTAPGKQAASWVRTAPLGRFGIAMRGVRAPVGGAAALDAVIEPARLPTNWLGYTSVRAVVIGAGEWAQLDEAQKGALLTWTACGGDLIVPDGGADALTGEGHRTNPLVAGGARAYFFGRIFIRPSDSIEKAGLNAVLDEVGRLHDANWALPANSARDWGVIRARGFRLPIPGIEGIPTRAYLAILIVFSLVIGPANYWFLRRRGRQVIFVLTAPLISALFIALLAGYVLVGEGLHVSGRAATFTLLDQGRRQAATRASFSLYAAGMAPGRGLTFPRDVAVYPIGSDGNGIRDTQTLDLTDSQQFASGLIRARAPTNVEAIGFNAVRERLSFTPDAGGVRVVNGLGVPIERLQFRSGGKGYILSAPLAAGAAATLTPGTLDPYAVVPGDLPQTGRFVYLFDHQPDGSYLAVLGRSPFWDAGLHGIVEHGSFHLLLGWADGQP